jgi:2-dehydro-3-deoxygalactonokinase
MTASEKSTASLIAIDWGTTNRRGYLIGQDGDVLDTREDSLGLANVADGAFEAAFDDLVAPWMETHGVLPVLLSGMVGASTGWREAAYCDLPTGLDDLAGKLARVPGARPVWIVPGVSTHDETGMPDVIRGTHSKWVRMAAGQIVGFRTYMTGDLHAAILNHTIIAKLANGAGGSDPDAFTQGVAVGHAHHGDLTHILFGARSRVLFWELSAEAVPGYLSGLLIGAEIASALSTHHTGDAPIKLIGSDALSVLYRQALEACGAKVAIAGTDRVTLVYREVALRAGILEG